MDIIYFKIYYLFLEKNCSWKRLYPSLISHELTGIHILFKIEFYSHITTSIRFLTSISSFLSFFLSSANKI